jgi:phosphoenolpyruvate synthase/pyruvate phosphate dikinase
MKLEEQVLSVEQVRELQELGFDIEKHSSMCWVAYTSDEEPYEKEYSLSILDEFCYESASLEPIPTMSIGDMIEVLPETIHKNYSLEISKHYVDYCDDHISINGEVEEKLIDAFFEMLKWCIKEKQIKL